ncbi:branched-chain amino acid ABC transporter periplasmic binding protein (plasmid) [Ruegeria pomeroyi DSS-3]|uniref:Branched-chain amino acid ABC transporter, periplasmic branched-chain amino acid-binding protein, putative n=2 Tax=Ruegeria pomeroyi TaxID=89184 RepID=Q5LLC7_RUEPO|nr:branched-chain amino acid ABC transporter periplasmic binding protein [Ruegeria pomeroyi DSS-3]NVK98122.1 ABC transporter substrate-binding protein [Ruegeria pomeroyi]NVL02695.1 ABC transporter substrate-binding protein [Ruegeria pomeroyi]HCE71156.1 branched-chain amino acid ABC transporter substrate-binding protein [Ruegeria sp.]
MTRNQSLNRRSFLAGSAAFIGTLAAPSIVTAASKKLRIGFISPLSGPRASFGTSDQWMVETISKHLSGGLISGGASHEVEIIVKDNQSNMNRSISVGNELLLRDQVDMLLINDGDAAVALGEIADIHGVPTMSTMQPWQAWMFPRGSNPEQGFPWTFHFFWGADDAMSTFTRLWDQIDTNKVVGDFYLDNPVGNAFADPAMGLPGFIERGGYSRVDGGMFKIDADDYSGQVSRFKEAGADIVTGFGFPPHWITFWNQAGQAGYTPKACTFAAAFLFPQAIEAMGDRGDGMTTEVWWTPNVPFASSLTGQTARELADAWEAESNAQWVQTLGYSHALFETGLNALVQSGAPKDRAAVRDVFASTRLDTVVGPVNFADSPIRNTARTQLAGGQWRKSSGKHAFELVITENTLAPDIGVESETIALPQV